ncbi:TetR/AcrR family transcriptional regulator [Nocardia sp. NPDC051570]|uniref:TetR/AcrR family transcriptional regulator n=1 Tax=Nocardia sp. NPDC051570 TaxID=3364324 RepID=UPI0037971E04
MAPTPRKRNARGQGSALRHEIVDAATRLLAEADTESELTLRSIARAAGVSAPAIYPHFPDRDAVIDAVAEAGWEDLVGTITGNAQHGRNPRERLMLGCVAYVEFARRHPLRYQVMTQRVDEESSAAKSMQVLADALARCRTEAAVGDSGVIAAGLSAALHGIAMLNCTGSPALWIGIYPTDTVLAQVVDGAINQPG